MGRWCAPSGVPGFAPAQDSPESLLQGEASSEGQSGNGATDADRIVRAQVPPEGMRELASLLLEVEAWEQKVDTDDVARLEDSRTELRIEAREASDRSRIWEYTNDRARLQRVKLALEALASRYATQGEADPRAAEQEGVGTNDPGAEAAEPGRPEAEERRPVLVDVPP